MAKYKQYQPGSSLSKSYTVYNVFQCTRLHCKRVFNDFEELRDHHAFIHGNDDGYQLISCPVCKANFDSQTKLDIHKKTHASVLDGGMKPMAMPTRKCPHCPIYMKSKVSLDQHIRACHGGKSLPVDLRKVQQPTTLSMTKLIIPSSSSGTTVRRLVPTVVIPNSKLQKDGAVHASDIMKTSFSAASSSGPSVVKSASNSQSAEKLMQESTQPTLHQNLFNNMRIVTLSSGQAASTSSKPANRGPSTRVNNMAPKTYDCQRCGTTFKNRCSLTLHEMKHKQKESDFHCPAPKCYCAFNTKKKLRGHMSRSHPELFEAEIKKECGGIGFEALMNGSRSEMNSSVDSLDMSEEGSLQTSECTTEILITPRYSTTAKDVHRPCSSTSLVQFVDVKEELRDGGGDDEEVGGDGLVIDEGMADERADEWTVGAVDGEELQEEEAVDDQPGEESFDSSLRGLSSSSSSASAAIAVEHEFEQLDKALSCR